MLHFQLHLAALNLWMLESLIHAVNWPAWHTDGFQYFAPIFGAFSLHQFGQQGHELFAVETARRASIEPRIVRGARSIGRFEKFSELPRSEKHPSKLRPLMTNPYTVLCL